MLMGITASAVPNGGTRYNLTAVMDYGWLDLMYRMYPNMEGTLNTENHWSGHQEAVATGSTEHLILQHATMGILHGRSAATFLKITA